MARAVWIPQPNFRMSAQAWLTAGGPHHTVLSSAVGTEEINDFADMVRTELLVIDEQTRMRDFRNEIRWNQAYFRLAQESQLLSGGAFVVRSAESSGCRPISAFKRSSVTSRFHRPSVRIERQRRQQNGHGQDHRKSSGRLPRRLSHRRQRQSGQQRRPADLGVPAHPRPAGHPADHLRTADRWFPDGSEYNNQAGSGGQIRFRHYANLSALLAGTFEREQTIPRTLSACNEGTPNIYSVSLTPDIDHSDHRSRIPLPAEL